MAKRRKPSEELSEEQLDTVSGGTAIASSEAAPGVEAMDCGQLEGAISPLMKGCATGEHIKEATITIRKAK
jgi:hypothetical protein